MRGWPLLHRYIPDNPYQGLETPDADKSKNPAIAYEALADHAQHNPEHYDVVCAFQVLEHVTDPVAFINTAKACLKPGGLLIIGLPNYDSYLQHLVNFTLNAPPHHISWWQTETLRELGRQCHLNTLDIDKAPLEHWESRLYWMQWLGKRLTGINSNQRPHFSSQKRWRWLTPLLYVGACLIDSLTECLETQHAHRLNPGVVSNKVDHKIAQGGVMIIAR